jgi:hypothetical protein
MQYCGERGIPHSRFLTWDPHDQDLALAWLIDKTSHCPKCGTYGEDWLDEDGRATEPPPFRVETHRCYGCVAVDDALEKVPSDQRMSITTKFVRQPRDPS